MNIREQNPIQPSAELDPSGSIFLPEDPLGSEAQQLALLLRRGPYAGVSPEEQIRIHHELIGGSRAIGAHGVTLVEID